MTKNNRPYYSLISVMLTVCMLLHVVYPMIANAAEIGRASCRERV